MQNSGKSCDIIAGASFALAVVVIQVVLFDRFFGEFVRLSSYELAGHPGLLSFAALCFLGCVLDITTQIQARFLWFGAGVGFAATVVYNTFLHYA